MYLHRVNGTLLSKHGQLLKKQGLAQGGAMVTVEIVPESEQVIYLDIVICIQCLRFNAGFIYLRCKIKDREDREI